MSCNRTRPVLLIALLAVVFPVLATAAGAPSPDPATWPEAQRAFLQDGPGFLLSEAQVAELAALDAAGRDRFIADFLATDPLPETAVNELTEGIRRRTLLARSAFLSPRDVRYRVLFLAGLPSERLEVDCGVTFRPLQVWSYPPDGLAARTALARQRQLEGVVQSELVEGSGKPFEGWDEGPRLVFYQPAEQTAWRLWQPFDSKRALYSDEMEYFMLQYEELRGRIRGRRFDLQACPETVQVEQATGVEGLRAFRSGRPTRGAISSFLEPPADLATWARQAAATPLPETSPTLEVGELTFLFPGRHRQRMEVRIVLPLPPGAELTLDEEGETDLVVDGVLESGGEVFTDFRVRYRQPPPAAGTPVALAVDQALRPGQSFVARLRVRDDLGGAQGHASAAFTVPGEPDPAAAAAAVEELVLLGESMAQQVARASARDSLLLAPPLEGTVALGLWRAEVLVTGDRIEKVAFLVDGEVQLTRTRPPFSAEVRLAKYPVEQVVRVEGYDAAGEQVAADEVVLNQPRGAFRVAIVEPRRGSLVEAGAVAVWAEVVVPDEREVEKVEIRLGDELLATLTRPPWRTEVVVPATAELSYLAATATLDDGRSAEDVRFLNAPKYLDEVDVRLVELYTSVVDRSGRPVRGLGEGELEVFEDGRPQRLVKFELVENLPLTVGIAIDTSGSMRSSLVEAQRAGRAFLDRVVTGPADRCLVVGFSRQPSLLMPPSDDVEACALGLAGLMAVGWTALHDAVITSLYYMREIRGQRALVLLSDGDDTASSLTFADAVDFARRSGAVIYSVGLNVGALDLDVRGKLSRLAEETGGRVFFIGSADELSGVYGEIEKELRSRYLLAYNSDRGTADTGFREVEVKVKRRGLSARTVAGYYP